MWGLRLLGLVWQSLKQGIKGFLALPFGRSVSSSVCGVVVLRCFQGFPPVRFEDTFGLICAKVYIVGLMQVPARCCANFNLKIPHAMFWLFAWKLKIISK